MTNTSKYICFIYLLLAITHGCSYAPTSTNEQLDVNLPAQSFENEQLYWWYARFKINWPENTAPDFSIDTMLADAIIKPVLLENQENIKLWRFHRRAHRDQAGHLFSFIFYADKKTAEVIFNNIKNKDLTKKLLLHGIIKEVINDNINTNDRTGIYSTSDKHWSDTLQIAWPYFSMGVSATWLELINQQAKESISNLDVEKQLVFYREINSRINQIWHDEGNHAFIHHLNALFGYEPLAK